MFDLSDRKAHDALIVAHRLLVDRHAALEARHRELQARFARAHYGQPVGTRIAEYDEALETLERANLTALLVAIADVRDGHPGAQRFASADANGSTRTPDPDDEPNPLTTDRAGETAIRLAEHPDRARHDHARAKRAMADIVKAANIVAGLHHAYAPRDPTAWHRSLVANQPGCRSCARLTVTLNDNTKVPRWTAIYRDQLCRWCNDWRRKAGGLPPLVKLQAHHEGARVMVTAGE